MGRWKFSFEDEEKDKEEMLRISSWQDHLFEWDYTIKGFIRMKGNSKSESRISNNEQETNA